MAPQSPDQKDHDADPDLATVRLEDDAVEVLEEGFDVEVDPVEAPTNVVQKEARSPGPPPLGAEPAVSESVSPAPTPADDGVGEFEDRPKTQALTMDDVQLLGDEPASGAGRSRPRSSPPPAPPPAPPPPVRPTPPLPPRLPRGIPRVPAGMPMADAAAMAEALHAEPAPGPEPESGPESEPELGPAEVGPAPGPTVLDEAIAEASGQDWKARAEALRVELETTQDRARAALLAYELGELAERRLRDEGAAVKAYGRALQSDASLRPNLWAIRRVFYRRALWPNLLKLIDAEVRFAADDSERADLYVEKARVFEDRLKDLPGAKEAYEKAIALDPSNLSALLARERLALRERDEATLETLWRKLADATATPSRKVGYLLDLTRLWAGRGDKGLARAAELIAEAESLGVERARVVRERLRVAERSGDVEAQLGALEAQLALLAEGLGAAGDAAPGDPALLSGGAAGFDRGARIRHEMVAIRRRQAQLAAAAGQLDRAWRFLEQASALAPGEPLVALDLAELAETAGRWDDLADLLARLLALETGAGHKLALGLLRAEALVRAGRQSEAESVLDSLVAAAPGYLPVVALRQRRAALAGDWERMASLLSAEAGAARLGTIFGEGDSGESDPLWAAAAYVAAGDVYDLRLGRDEDARAAYGQALEAAPGYWPAVWALVALHQRAGRLGDACALLERELDTLSGDDELSRNRKEEALEELARMYEELGRTDDALRATQRLGELRPDDALLRWRLEELYAAAGRAEERLALLGRLADRIQEPARRAAVLLELARLYAEDRGDLDRAIDLYDEVLSLTPEDRFARAARADLLARAGRWEELVKERRRAAADADGPAAAAALGEAAAILERKLGRPAEAVVLYRERVDRTPDDRAALSALAVALANVPGGDRAALAEVLERKVALLPEGATRAQELVRLGELYESLGRDEDAGDAFRRAREEGGAGLHAHWALVKLAARQGGGAPLAEALEALGDRLADEGLRADLAEEAAWQVDDDADAAAARFEALVAHAPHRRGAQLGRALVAARRGDAVALADALASQAQRTTDPRAAAALLLRAATLTEVSGARGGRGERGVDAGQLAARALSLVPEDPGALVAAAERPLPERRDEILARRAALAGEGEGRDDLEFDRALRLEEEGRLAAAGVILGEILARRPDHLGALAALRRIARRAGDLETVARASRRLAELLLDPESAASLLAEAAAILDRELGRPEEAFVLWRAVLERAPLDETAYARAREICRQAGDTAGLLELVSHRLRHVGGPSEEVPYRVERAALRAELGDRGGAATDLEKALEADPACADALSLLSDVRLAEGDAAAAAELLRRHIEAAPDDATRASGASRLARVLAEGLGDLEGACAALERAVELRPSDLEARERLARTLAALRRFDESARAFRDLAARRQDPRARARDELEAARIYRHSLGDRSRAREALEAARKLDPLAVEIVEELAAVSSGDARARVLSAAVADWRAALANDPAAPQWYDGLARVAALAGDEPLERLALAAFCALGGRLDGRRQGRLDELLARVETLGLAARRPISDDEWRARLLDPGARGELADLWAAVAEASASLGAHEPAQLGFHKKDHVGGKHVARQHPAVDAVTRLFGLGEYELFVSAARPGFARAVMLEVPRLYLGADIAAGETLAARALLGRAVAEIRLRVGVLEELVNEDLLPLGAMALRVAGEDPARVPAFVAAARSPRLDERARSLAKALSRRAKKALELASTRVLARASELDEAAVRRFREGVRTTVYRAALLVAGEPGALGTEGATPDVLAWAVGEDHLALRSELGLS